MLTNCIVWGNTGQPDIAGGSAATYSVTYSCVGTGVADGEGNISLDPLFVDLAGEDYHLRPSSPCIDAGSNDAPDLPDVDLDGYPRVVGSAVDMGAYEVQTPQTQLASLDELIAACVGEQSIAPELQSSLVAKINAAIAALNRGKPNDAKVAMNELKALVNQVQAQSGNKIDAAAAAEIILGADLVIEQLGG
jgi:hypothetical protein